MDNQNDLSFEQGVKKLEQILLKLENEDTPLDQMIDLYEQANKLTEICRMKLDEADKRMTKLVKNDNNDIVEE
ncbi:MAG: exodeoxyribonuclease VII small subunit [Candidatus Neomarinimicrobiota bacterium]|tara:strand:- start:622 stop:840 length:219 start_codon:yes stop_codon:yes gene_type:complete